MRKILVSLPDGVVEILDKEIIGKIGEGYSDTLRTIIMNWLSEQGYLAKGGKVEKSQS
jgi:metal-responsive CopG/Arc/MetJ family transcriptional regulator